MREISLLGERLVGEGFLFNEADCSWPVGMDSVEGVEMPGAKAHNEILGQFHLSLSQDEAFTELLNAPGARCGALEFCRLVVESEVNAAGLPTTLGESEREALLRDVIDVAGVEACLASAPDGPAFCSILRKLTPVLEECRAAMKDSRDATRMCRALELLCLVLRAVRYKRTGMLAWLDALGVEYDGEQLVRALIAQACRVLEDDGSSNFACTLALKLLNVLAGTRVHERDSVVLRWLWEGGTLMVLSRLMSHHRRFRHCLSLDTGVLQVCIGLHNLSAAAAAAANYEDLGDGLSSQRAVLAALESAAVLGDVASNHLLAAKSRKANLLESVILGAATVINDKKGSGDILAEGAGVGLTGGQMCYIEAFGLIFYYLATRHRRYLAQAFLSSHLAQARADDEALVEQDVSAGNMALQANPNWKRKEAKFLAKQLQDGALDQGGASVESGAGPDGLPLCYGSLVLFLSLLLHRPSGASARLAAQVLQGLCSLVEDAAVTRVLMSQNAVSTYKVFSADVGAQARNGVVDVQGQTAARALSEVVLAFLSDNLKLALEIEAQQSGVMLLHRMLSHSLRSKSALGSVCDVRLLVNVFLRQLTYFARDAVWKANAPHVYVLAARVSIALNALIVFGGDATILPPYVAPLKQVSRGGEGFTYPMLCYEVARCGCNKVFEKLLAHVLSSMGAGGPDEGESGGALAVLAGLADGAGVGSQEQGCSAKQKVILLQLQQNLELLRKLAGHINECVDQWVAQRPYPPPTEQKILEVVAECLPALRLEVQGDLLGFDGEAFDAGTPETDESWNIAQLASEALLNRYCAHIQVVPSRVQS